MGLSASSYLEDLESQPTNIRHKTSSSTISTVVEPLSDHQEKARFSKEIDDDDDLLSPTLHKLKSIKSTDRDKTFLYYSRQDDDGYFISSNSIKYSKEEMNEITESTDSLDQFLKFKADQFWNQHQKSIEAQREYNEQMLLMQQIREEEEEQMRCERLQQLQQNLNQIEIGINRLQIEYKTYANYFEQQCMQNMQGSNGQNVQQQYQQQIAVLNQNYVLQMNQLNVNAINIKKEIEFLSQERSVEHHHNSTLNDC